MENGLSIIEKPGLAKGFNRREYLGEAKVPTVRDTLRDLIDAALRGCNSFEDFLSAMKATGCDVKHGKHLAIKIPDAKRFIRLDSLGEDYSETALQERITGKRIVASKQKITVPAPAITKPNLLIDIQEKIQQGKGAGYEKWAKVFNLKEAAKTLIFLQERGLTEYEQLSDAADTASADFHKVSGRITEIDGRLKEISTLQKHIGTYSKTRDIFRQYHDGGKDRRFYNEHIDDITAHRDAKKHFDSLRLKTIPSMKALKQEYATLDAEKRKLYQRHRPTRDEMVALLMAKQNVDRMMNLPDRNEKQRDKSGHEL